MMTNNIAASGIVLEPLTKDNYVNWISLVQNYLEGHGVWGVVTSIPEIGAQPKSQAKENGKALHIIKLACGSENLAHIRNLGSAKEAWNHLKTLYGDELKAELDNEQGVMDDSLGDYKQLHRFIESGDWTTAKAIMDKDEKKSMDRDKKAMFSASSSGRTILHVAVIAGHEEIVKKLVNDFGNDKLVEMQDSRGYTALALVAELTGNTNIAKCLLNNKEGHVIRQYLLSMKTKDGEIPVLLAAAKGHKEMTSYLYDITPVEHLTDENYHNGVLLLTRCINAEIFDVALNLLQRFQTLPLAHKSKAENVQPLYALARMSSVFPSGSGYGVIRQFIYKCIRTPKRKVQNVPVPHIGIMITHKDNKKEAQSTFLDIVKSLSWILAIFEYPMIKIWQSSERRYGILFTRIQGKIFGWMHNIFSFTGIPFVIGKIREIYNKKITHTLAQEILNYLSKRTQNFNQSELVEASVIDAMLEAAIHGNIEFINAMRKANPDLLWAIDKNKRGVFSHAILNRRKQVFQLIHDKTVNGGKEIIRSRVDSVGNSLLHLAGELGPTSNLHRRSGPALQMQREILWFKEVEKIVHPKFKEAKNEEENKPHEIFTKSHKELVKAGEKWAKETAGSFTVVATLITTIMFAAAFTVPGGNNEDSGVPLFLHDSTFNVFIIADAISLFTSSTAVLFFIGILTSRYAEKDFLTSLPVKLFCGLVALFISVVAMMVAFCASLTMLLKGHKGVIIMTMCFAGVPVIVLVPSQLGLFIEIFKSTILSIY